MRRYILYLLLLIAVVTIVSLIPQSEYTFEFDAVNLRMRDCSRSRSWLFGFLLSESCSEPHDHQTAVKLRELGMIGPVREEDSRWVLIKGFKFGVRGWIGSGREYVRSLGASSFGTPVTLPAKEDLAENLWVKWAVKDPEGSRRFWRQFTDFSKQCRVAGDYLSEVKEYLEERKLEVDVAKMEAELSESREFLSRYRWD